MDAAVECTHCHVVMTSWSAPGSPVRYWQCPFCSRTHSSAYVEVFRRSAGARVLKTTPVRSSLPAAVPMATPEDVKWAKVKASATRWFARLEADEARNGPVPTLRTDSPGRHTRADLRKVPEADPADVIELAPARVSRKRG
jgi:hypothetical protein